MKTQTVRRIIQYAVFIFMFMVPFLNLLEIYFIKGTFISLDVGSLGIADPVMIFQAIMSSTSAAGVLLVSITIPLMIMLIFGRVWCSWSCPYTLILQWIERIPFLRDGIKARQAKIQNRVFRTSFIRYAVFIGFFVLVGVSGVPILHLFSPPAVISTQALLLVKTITVTIEVIFIITVLVVDTFFFYRFTCRCLCPTGTCLSLFKHKKALHVSYRGECLDCGACVKVCPMGLNPMTEADSRLCFNCGECIAACHDKDKPLFWSLDTNK